MNKYVIALGAVLFTTGLAAQTADPVLLTIDGKPITKSEFEAVYKKNNGKDMSAEKKTVREYLDLFINFKLKVKEAEQMGLDTAASFKQELGGYEKQLSAPYLTDKEVTDKLVKEAYERGKTEVNASYILIRCPEEALPKDTIEAWQRTNIIRTIMSGKPVPPAMLAEYEANVKKVLLDRKNLTAADTEAVMQRINTIKDLNSELAILKTVDAGKAVSAAQLNEYEKAVFKNHTGKTKLNAIDSMNIKKHVAQVKQWAESKNRNVFEHIARLISEDPSVKDNGGNLGYFTAFEMVYPFENVAFESKPGQLSNIVRTRFGYHVLKVIDKRPNSGEILTAHILLRYNDKMKHDDSVKVKQKIYEIYDKLKAGEKFADLAKNYSEDKQTAPNGGEMSWFYERKFPLEDFAKKAFALKNNGDFSEPFLTKYGWDIVKRVDWRDVPAFDAVKTELKNKVSRDPRSFLSKSSFMDKVKKEYNFKEIPKAADAFVSLIDTNYFKGTWKASAADKLNGEMFSLADKKYTQKDFAKYLESHQTRRVKTDAATVVKTQYKNFVEESLVRYEETQLAKKYPDYRNLMQEYRDGILLFDLTDRKVWSKAVKDSAGLQAFYEKNKNNYLWDERADVTTYKCANEEIAREVHKMLEKKKSEKEILEKMNKKSQLDVTAETVTYLKGENKTIDANWKEGISPEIAQDGKVLVLNVNKLMPKTPKKLAECRGLVTADYQNFLEKDWIANLRNNHKIEVKEDVLATIK